MISLLIMIISLCIWHFRKLWNKCANCFVM